MLQKIKMIQSVYDQIHETIGNRMPECGGILGAGENGIITKYYFDESGKSDPDAYTPDVEAVNRVLETWHKCGIHMVGIVHSHKEGVNVPSCGDIAYAVNILNTINTVEEFYLPILVKQGTMSELYGYLISKKSECVRCEKLDILIQA